MNKLFARITSIALLMALSVSAFPTEASAGERSIKDIPDITNEEAAAYVQEAFENYKKHDAVCYTLEYSSGWEFYGYDFVNRVGVISYPSDDYATYRDAALDYKENSWLDYNSRIDYEMDYDDNNEPVYYMSEIPKKDVDAHIDQNFADLFKTKENSFPLAGQYEYIGKSLVFTPNYEAHICYVIEIPDSDESLYPDEDMFYIPKTIYVGADDKEVYRIDEERLTNDYMDYSIREYHTYFSYPKELKVPKKVKKNSIIDPNMESNHKGVRYSSSYDGKSFMVFAYDYKKKYKKIKIFDKVTILGYTKKVTAIDYDAFINAKVLKKVTFGKYIKTVGENAFNKCKKLKKVVFNKKLKLLNDGVFMGCSSLKKLEFPKSLKSIGKDAFKDCKKLKTVVVKNKKLRKWLDSAKGRKKTGLSKDAVVK